MEMCSSVDHTRGDTTVSTDADITAGLDSTGQWRPDHRREVQVGHQPLKLGSYMLPLRFTQLLEKDLESRAPGGLVLPSLGSFCLAVDDGRELSRCAVKALQLSSLPRRVAPADQMGCTMSQSDPSIRPRSLYHSRPAGCCQHGQCLGEHTDSLTSSVDDPAARSRDHAGQGTLSRERTPDNCAGDGDAAGCAPVNPTTSYSDATDATESRLAARTLSALRDPRGAMSSVPPATMAMPTRGTTIRVSELSVLTVR